jgi:hypothetical protein
MQLHGGRGFTSANPQGSIATMIHDGLLGTDATPGYARILKNSNLPGWVLPAGPVQGWEGNPFAAAHMYNVGSLTSTDLTKKAGGVTSYYANDIAARLTGWKGAPSACAEMQKCFPGRSCY